MPTVRPADQPPSGPELAEPGPEPARRLRRDAEANRQRILAAAGRLMADRGLATPIEDIAAAAGVGVGTLYRRFPSRNDLIDALFEERMAALITLAESALEMDDGWAGFVWFLDRAFGRQIEDRALGQLVEQDCASGRVHVVRERVGPLAERLVARARESGRLRPDFEVTDLLLIQKMVVTVGAATVHHDPGLWRRYLTMLLDGLVVRRDRPTALGPAALSLEEAERMLASGPSDQAC